MPTCATPHPPTRIQEEIQIFNVSLPLPMKSNDGVNEDYEPELGELLRAVECPVCRCTPNPPIYNCVNGHFSCASCHPRLPLQRCAYCTGKFTRMRNYPLEGLVTAKAFLCDFRHAGCQVKEMNMIEYEEHMRKCWFRSLAAPKSVSLQDLPNVSSSSVVNPIEFSCPRCNFMNSKRKLKCQNCHINLRIPTPMCSRPSWVMSAATRNICSNDSSS